MINVILRSEKTEGLRCQCGVRKNKRIYDAIFKTGTMVARAADSKIVRRDLTS